MDYLQQLLSQLSHQYFSHLDLPTVLDLLIVAIIFYWLVVLVRGTRAVQLLFGLSFLVGLYAVSVWLNLALLKWVLEKGSLPLLVAIPVVFQPELRRGLERIGRLGSINRFLSPLTPQVINRMVNEIVRAVTLLAGRRYGGLIVIERGTGLVDYTETGIIINGRLSAELLCSIFFPHSPLHDGATIINGETVVAAGCLLPLSDNLLDSHHYGTRHRAALGVTEQTDAIAIMVSEETGSIMIMSAGRVIRNLDEHKLRKVLVSMLKQPVVPALDEQLAVIGRSISR